MRALVALALAACSFPRPADVGPSDGATSVGDAARDALVPDAPVITPDAQLLAFSIDAALNGTPHDFVGTITGTTIDLYGYGTYPTLKPFFTPSPGATVTVFNVAQLSGQSAQSFSQPVPYLVHSMDGLHVTPYTVRYHPRELALNMNLVAPGSTFATLAAGDLDGDGKADLAVGLTTATVQLYPNQTTGPTVAFGTALSLPTAGPPTAIAFADLDGDGKPEIIVASATTLEIFRNSSTTNQLKFAPAVPVSFNANGSAVVAADLNNDGALDLAVANGTDNNVAIRINTTPQSTTAMAPFAFGVLVSIPVNTNPTGLAVADFTGDGLVDILVANHDAASITLIANTTLVNAPVFTSAGGVPAMIQTNAGTRGFALGDFNDDGLLDAIVATDGVPAFAVFVNGGMDASSVTSTPPTMDLCVAVAALDLDNDGRRDTVVVEKSPSTGQGLIEPFITGIPANLHPVFKGYSPISGSATPLATATGDFNGDGLTDLAVLYQHGYAILTVGE